MINNLWLKFVLILNIYIKIFKLCIDIRCYLIKRIGNLSLFQKTILTIFLKLKEVIYLYLYFFTKVNQ